MNIERTSNIGKLIETYRMSIEDALKASRQLEKLGIERPWITVELDVSAEEYFSNETLVAIYKEDEPNKKYAIKKRVRLEIR